MRVIFTTQTFWTNHSLSFQPDHLILHYLLKKVKFFMKIHVSLNGPNSGITLLFMDIYGVHSLFLTNFYSRLTWLWNIHAITCSGHGSKNLSSSGITTQFIFQLSASQLFMLHTLHFHMLIMFGKITLYVLSIQKIKNYYLWQEFHHMVQLMRKCTKLLIWNL